MQPSLDGEVKAVAIRSVTAANAIITMQQVLELPWMFFDGPLALTKHRCAPLGIALTALTSLVSPSSAPPSCEGADSSGTGATKAIDIDVHTGCRDSGASPPDAWCITLTHGCVAPDAWERHVARGVRVS